MYRVLFTIAFLFYYSTETCDCANILVIIPTPIYSHQSTFRSLWKTLSLRGHQVTLVTTHPMKNSSLTNLTEVDISFLKKVGEENRFLEILGDSRSMGDKGMELLEINYKMTDQLYVHPEVQNLIHNESLHYDLLITEALFPSMIAFSWRFNCPWIGVSSLDVNMYVHDALGNSVHPLLVPEYNSIIEDHENLSFGERFAEAFGYVMGTVVFVKQFMIPEVHRRVQEYFGPDLRVPHIQDILNNISMIFININPLIHALRPLNPNTIMVGSGLHIEPPKELPKNIKKFIEEAEHGVIYFSLGSNIVSNLVKEDLQNIFLDTFRELPYRILWRFDLKSMKNVPGNVLIEEWFPQQDILRHPKVKLFIMQGGLQSLEETLIFGVPIIGIPFFGDQFHNVRKAIKLGIGKEIKREDISKTSLTKSIKEVIRYPRYRKKTLELGKILHDRPMTSLDETVWWTEYVIRNKGAKYLKNHYADIIPFYQYYFLDFTLFFIIFLVIVFIVYKVIKRFVTKKKKPQNIQEELKKKN